MGGRDRQEFGAPTVLGDQLGPWQDGVIGSGIWSRLLGEVDLTMREGLAGTPERFSEGPKVGAIAEFLGENFSTVDVAINVFDLD